MLALSHSFPEQEDDQSVAFDVRILQTQVHKINGEAFTCDTFFPEDLTFNDISSPWRAVSARILDKWVDGIDVPGASKPSTSPDLQADPSEFGGEDEDDGWVRDDKAGVELRVVGWERR